MCSNRIEQEERRQGSRRRLMYLIQLSIPAMILIAGMFQAVAS